MSLKSNGEYDIIDIYNVIFKYPTNIVESIKKLIAAGIIRLTNNIGEPL